MTSKYGKNEKVAQKAQLCVTVRDVIYDQVHYCTDERKHGIPLLKRFWVASQCVAVIKKKKY